RSKVSLLSAWIAASPPSATVTSWPACFSMIASNSRMLRSSSTTRTRVSGMAIRQRHREHGPEAGRAADVHVAAVLLDEPVDEREAEPGAPGLGGEERLEDVGEVVGRDAVPAVRHRHFQLVAGELVRTSIAPVSDASGLRISWAMLAAIRPSVARRSAWRIRASIARIADRSSHAPISPSRAPSPERSAEKVSRTGTVVPSGRR